MKNALPEIYVVSRDYERLSQLIQSHQSPAALQLEEELARAQVLPDEELPFPIVKMDSTVTFRDLESGKESQVTLVYPEAARIEERKVSILAPVGVALIGLSLNEEIEWPLPNGKSRRLQVIRIENEADLGVAPKL